MTIAETITRIRQNLGEKSAGFWADANLYYWIDDAQIAAFNIGIQMIREGRLVGRKIAPEFLQGAIARATTDTQITNEYYTLPTGYVEFSRLKVRLVTAPTTLYPATLIPFSEFEHIFNNYFLSPHYSEPQVAVAEGKYWILPYATGVYTGAIVFDYYKRPTAITGGGSSFTLGEEAHPGIALIASSYAMEKKDSVKSKLLLEKGEASIRNLI